MQHSFLIRSIISSCYLVLAMPILAGPPSGDDCEAGKSPVTVATPSGKIRTLCMPDNAVAALEEAPNSGGAGIIAATCPCFSFEEVETLLETATIGWSEDQLWQGGDGTPEACRTVGIIATDGAETITLGAGTSEIDPQLGCLTTDNIPTGFVTPYGCLIAYGGYFLGLNPISHDESEACVSLLAEFVP